MARADGAGVDDEDARLIALAQAGRQFAACSSLDTLLPRAADLALVTLQASSASLARLEHERGLLRVLHNVGELAPWEVSTPDDETYAVADFPLLAATAEASEPWFGDLDDPDTGASHHALLRAMGMHSSISLPVVVGSTVWGEIGAARTSARPSFSPADIAAGEAFSGLLAAAITRIVERDALHALAFRDALTGLGNRRAIDDRLEELFARRTLQRSVSVILCDVDGLKRINDVHGHDAGDRILREVAALLARAAGGYPESLAVRLGGDEFCLLLVGVPERETRAVCDELMLAGRGLPLGAGLSAGWSWTATRPGDAPTATAAARAVLRLADAAQYRTKRAARAGRHDQPRATAVPPDDTATTGHRLAEVALLALETSGEDPLDRLCAVAEPFLDQLDACTWVVSRSSDGGPVEVLRRGDTRSPGSRPAEPIELGSRFALEDYPATAEALAGGAFHATVDRGDLAERGFLAAHGYDEVIGAGTRQDARTSWLVEIVGDALTAPLHHALPLLRLLVVVAVHSEWGAARVSWCDGSSG